MGHKKKSVVEAGANSAKPKKPNRKKEEIFPENAKVPAAAHSSLKDLVVYNERGQATIDLNILIYKPNPNKVEEDTEIKYSSFVPDYLFIIFNFLGLTFSTYYLINGLTIVSWTNNMQLFTVEDCDQPILENIDVCNAIKDAYPEKNSGKPPYTILRFDGFTDPSIHGTLLLVIGLLNFANIIIGINGCIDGSYVVMITHLVLDGALIVVEVILVTVIGLTGTCLDKDIDIIREFLYRHVYNYASENPEDFYRKETLEMDAIQLSLTCCGVGNWTDYLPRVELDDQFNLSRRELVPRFNLDNSDMVIPSSCCRQWWIRNLYCAYEAHLWAYPTITSLEAHRFRQRISQLGCLPRMVGLCNNMIRMGGLGGAVAWGIHFLLSIVRQFCGIILVGRGKRSNHGKDSKKKNNMGPQVPDDTDSGPEFGKPDDDDDLPDMPRENDIAHIKSRRSFNIVRSAMKDTHMENWIQNGQKFVEGTDASQSQSKLSNSSEEDEFSNELRNRGKPTRQMDQENITHVPSSNHENKDEEEGNAADVVKIINNMANH